MKNRIGIINFSDFRLGDILINRNFYRSISHFHKKELVIFSKNISPIEETLKYDNLSFISVKNDFRKGFRQIHDYVKFLNQIKKNNIKIIYVLDDNLRPILFSFFSGINELYGFGFGIQKIFLTNKKHLKKKIIKKNKHYILENFLSILNIPFSKETIKINKNINIPENNNIFINLDSSSELKNWGDENFFKLIKKINSVKKKNFIINCLNYKTKIFDYLNDENISFKDVSHLSISDLFNSINNCDFSITNDTGPSHISIALAKKTFIIFLENNKFNYKYSEFMYPIIVDKEYKDINKVYNKIKGEVNI
tara:strand:- start:72 stop:998 length:927 start_codon:yes stop_codon:yes gene_type:complete